jgi:antitoxin CcdA
MHIMLRETRTRFRDAEGRKRPTNVSLSASLVDEARELGINISQACEDGLSAATKRERERRWLEENREAMESWNRYVEEHGLPLAKYRRF